MSIVSKVTDIVQEAIEHPIAKQARTTATEAIEGATKGLTKVGKTISGEEHLERARELYERQRRYNDVLATRLAEALDKIAELDARLIRIEAERGR